VKEKIDKNHQIYIFGVKKKEKKDGGYKVPWKIIYYWRQVPLDDFPY
jgi:hypothetical protein